MEKSFRHVIEGQDCHCKYYRGAPGLKGREFHDFHEIVLFICGTTQLITKNIQLNLSEGSLLLIPRGCIHQMIVDDEENYTRCIIGFKDEGEIGALAREVMSEATVITAPSDRIKFCFEGLMSAFDTALDEKDRATLLKATLTMILLDLKSLSVKPIREFVTVSRITSEALDYIDGHLCKELTVRSIANALNVSVSSLSHHFSEEMSISVYRYVSEKRIVNAATLIETGMSAAQAARESGFKDYSGFFRLYKKYYGKSPVSK